MANPFAGVPPCWVLFDAVGAPPQTGSTQMGKLFPTTIAIAAPVVPVTANAQGLPLVGGHAGKLNITNGGNVCGGVFTPLAGGPLLLDFACTGASNGVTLTVEIGRIVASGAIAQVLASVVLTTSTLTISATTVDPFTGFTRASTTWRFFDTTVITAYSAIGDVLQSVSGSSGKGPSQLLLNNSSGNWFYAQITALDASITEVLCTASQVF